MRRMDATAGAANAVPCLSTLEAAGFAATVDAFAWEPDPEASPPRMRLWCLSLLGPQQSVKALWARLVRGEGATMRLHTADGLAQARFCALAPEGPRGWHLFTASLPASAGYHGLLVPEAALYTSERPNFLLLQRPHDAVAALYGRFLNRRVDLPLHPSWQEWLWQRALRTGEAVALEACGLRAYRCAAASDTLAADVSAALRQGTLRVPEGTRGVTDEGEAHRHAAIAAAPKVA